METENKQPRALTCVNSENDGLLNVRCCYLGIPKNSGKIATLFIQDLLGMAVFSITPFEISMVAYVVGIKLLCSEISAVRL